MDVVPQKAPLIAVFTDVPGLILVGYIQTGSARHRQGQSGTATYVRSRHVGTSQVAPLSFNISLLRLAEMKTAAA